AWKEDSDSSPMVSVHCRYVKRRRDRRRKSCLNKRKKVQRRSVTLLGRARTRESEMGFRVNSTIHPRVFWGSTIIVALFLLIGILFPADAQEIFGRLQSVVIESFGWFYILAVALFFFAIAYLALSRYGNLKLGPDDSEPDYPYLTWMAMLF